MAQSSPQRCLSGEGRSTQVGQKGVCQVEGGGGACWAEGTACDCDRVWLGRLQQAKICVSLGLWPCGGWRGAVRLQGWLDWGGLGKHEACPGCHGWGPCPSFGMGLGAPTGQQVESSSWNHDGEGAVEPSVTESCVRQQGQGEEEERKARLRRGGSWGPAVSGRGQGNRGRSLMQALEGFQTLRVPSPLLQSLGWGDGKGGAGGWVLQNVLSLHPRPPGGAPSSFLPALGRPPPAHVHFQPHRWDLAGAWLSNVTLDKAQAYPHQERWLGCPHPCLLL